MKTRLGLCLLLAPTLLWLLALIVMPQIDMALLSLHERVGVQQYRISAAQYLTFFDEPLYWRTYVRTALLSAATTVITLAMALPMAWMLAKLLDGRARAVGLFACLMPFWVSETVRTLGWMTLLRQSGLLPHLLTWLGWTQAPVELLYHDATVLVGLVYSGLLFMVVPVYNAMSSLDDALVEAAYDLGASHWAVSRDIVLPHIAPGIAAGSIVVFMLTLGSYLTPTLMGGKNALWFTEQIYTQFITRFNWEQGAAFGVLLLVVSTFWVWLGLRVSGQRFSEVMQRV